LRELGAQRRQRCERVRKRRLLLRDVGARSCTGRDAALDDVELQLLRMGNLLGIPDLLAD
jgi:hypothetical protein